jgi:transposase-like protein
MTHNSRLLTSYYNTYNPDHCAASTTNDYQTIHEKRYQDFMRCPFCSSMNIKQLAPNIKSLKNNFHYLCVACNSRFNNYSETSIGIDILPLQVWLKCWYLFSRASSSQSIATAFGLNISTVEAMINKLQKIFHSKQPITFLTYDEWTEQHGQSYGTKVRNQVLVKEALLGETERQPNDTAEMRRQQSRRRNFNPW